MTQTQNTPGPWVLEPTVKTSHINIFGTAKNREYFVGTLIAGSAKDCDIFKANARLIAAAVNSHESLIRACHLLVQAYASGEANDAHVDWDEVDLAYDAAQLALGMVRGH